ncbi:MAG TPA: hypothetical protein VK714_01895 [Myxococcota bacterium]|nr:hypothetical protein [Myxococcota bacterium]
MAGSIVKRGGDSWLVRISLSGSGKRRFHNHTVHGTKKDAQRYLNAALRSRDLGTFVEPARMTLDAYLDKWLLLVHSRRPSGVDREGHRRPGWQVCAAWERCGCTVANR